MISHRHHASGSSLALLLLLCLPLLPRAAGASQWVSRGPYGARVVETAAGANGLFYALTERALYRSTDAGASWTRTSLFENAAIRPVAIAASGDDLYLATDSGVYASRNQGGTWRLASDVAVSAIAASGSSLWMAGERLLHSDDHGLHLSDASGDLPPVTVRRFFPDPLAHDCAYLLCASGRVYRTDDGGTRWQRVSSNIDAVAVSRTDPGTIFAGGILGISCSVDAGGSWSDVTPTNIVNGRVVSIAITAEAGESVYALFVDEAELLFNRTALLRSRDHGRSWERVWSGGGRRIRVEASRDAVLLTGSTPGILRSSDGGTSWSRADQGISEVDISFVRFDPASRALYAGSHDGAAWVSRDLGGSWEELDLPWSEWQSIAIRGRTILLGGTESYSGFGPFIGCGLFRSDDAGRTWNGIPVNGDVSDVVIDPATGAIYLAVQSWDELLHGVYRSVDDGVHWARLDWPDDRIRLIAIDPAAPGRFYAAGNTVSMSVDDGTTWSSPAIDAAAASILLTPGAPSRVCYGSDSVFCADSGTLGWRAALSGIPSGGSVDSLAAGANGTLYAVFSSNDAQGGAILWSLDRGLTWRALSPPLSEGRFTVVTFVDGHLAAGSDRGIWILDETLPQPPRRRAAGH